MRIRFECGLDSRIYGIYHPDRISHFLFYIPIDAVNYSKAQLLRECENEWISSSS